MILERIIVGRLEANCYIVGDETTKEVAVIDPGAEGSKIYKHIEEKGYKVIYIIATHGHVDHISGIKYIKDKSGAKVVIHKNDRDALTDSRMNLSIYLGFESVQCPADICIEGGEVLYVGRLKLEFIHTPGHTTGGMCILVDGKLLFSGDTLFEQSIGRTDLPGGNYQQLIKSIKEKLFVMPDDLEVYPGHGEKTTIGREKSSNPYV
ncbi:MAG: MBL fold metallo-hydrolase [Clostridiaceae bacterium]|nr:MBL fold metallo-hydrolase [Clostridiaceae bacterium]